MSGFRCQRIALTLFSGTELGLIVSIAGFLLDDDNGDPWIRSCYGSGALAVVLFSSCPAVRQNLEMVILEFKKAYEEFWNGDR